MPGDRSRTTFDRKKHYSAVLQQQGRVQLDADWNEQLAIQAYRTTTETSDIIGASGTPKGSQAFSTAPSADASTLTIAPGRLYVDGLLCELEAPATYASQPHLPNPPAPADGAYLAYVDCWERELTALDDPQIREVALGGPDTTTRLQTVFQILLHPLADIAEPPSCDAVSPPAPANGGLLTARTAPVDPSNSPCVLAPTAGYTSLENQLYRVEVHLGGPRASASFKWSRNNASFESKITSADVNGVSVETVGPDEALGFRADQWVEIVDEESTLKQAPHALFRIVKLDPATKKITLSGSASAFSGRSGLKLRGWDQSGASSGVSGVATSTADWIDLEAGIQVQFGEGDYKPGDYWLIPARTATGQIEWPPFEGPSQVPLPQPPRGVQHHFAKLALVRVSAGKFEVLSDCREQFPSLTHICAEDVCFDDTNCQLQGAANVQQALDRLCAERDLRFHKKHLHGWGIVCGLQVECGPCPPEQLRRNVTVHKGYAIDPDGNDVMLDQDSVLDLMGVLESDPTYGSTTAEGDTWVDDVDVCLVLDPTPGAPSPIRVEPYPAVSNDWREKLKGTLLVDFYNDAIQSLIDFVKDEFTEKPGETHVVGPALQRVTTFTNLLIGLVNQQNGANVFLSGERFQSPPGSEDAILRDFYSKLRDLLKSHTFCAMFDSARPFPTYPYSGLDIHTLFSKGLQTRLRVSPNGKFGYSMGAGTKINVFDLTKNEMVLELEFPGGSAAIVRDVAFSKDGKQLYAVATINDKDSMFAIASVSVSDATHTFGKGVMFCDVLLMSLATCSASQNVFASGKPTANGAANGGLYSINPQNVDGTVAPSTKFNAVGQLVVDDAKKLFYAAASGGTSPTDVYDRVIPITLAGAAQAPIMLTVGQPVTGRDDITLAVVNQQHRLYVVTDPGSTPGGKKLLVFNTELPAAGPAVLPLGQDTAFRLAFNPTTNVLMVTYEDGYRVGMIDATNHIVADYVPAQVSPLSIAMSSDNTRVYVLNYLSNTVSSIPATRFASGKQIAIAPLISYRAGVLDAFVDLLGGLLQYLKDALCDHLLIQCPPDHVDGKLYLACVSVRDNQVYKVCNFSKRKYVHSFPTVEYWMSLFPVLPLLKQVVEQACCAALPSLFGKFEAPRPAAPPAGGSGDLSKNTLPSQPARQGLTFVQQADLGSIAREIGSKLSAGKMLGFDALSNVGTSLTAKPKSKVIQSDVAGSSVEEATSKLQAAGIAVESVDVYDPKSSRKDIVALGGAPARLEPGSKVRLVAQDGKVLYYAQPTASADPAMQAQVTALKSDLAQLRQAHANELAARDKEIEELKGNVRNFEATAHAVTELRAQFASLRR